MADFGALSKLTKKADAVAESASVLVSRSVREIRGELANLSKELNLAGNADDRERAYQLIRAKMNRLARQLNRLMVAQNQLAAQAAATSASKMTGVEIRYSAKRAKAVTEMVTPAQGENLAAVFTDKMASNIIGSLREATVAALREQAVSGGSMKETAAAMSAKWHEAVKDGVPHFVDSSGREWNTAAYFQMNVRTNTMRVYNDCLIDDVARETGSDVMRISTGGSDPNCDCAAWEGTLISLTGKTPGLPTYDDAKAGGCFHPNCVHTLEVVDEYADADEIKRAQEHPFDKPDDDADIWEVQDNRKYEIDQAVKMDEEGLTQEQARVAVDRDNLAASIRAGLIREDAEALVAKMTDEQVTRLCPNGNPPEFAPFKPTKAELADGATEKWNHGRWGGVVHIKKDADLAHILSVTKADAQQTNAAAPVAAPKPKDEWKPATDLERATDAQMAAIGIKHTTKKLDIAGTNPDYSLAQEEVRKRGLRANAFTYNCQRCVPAYEMRFRGYDVKARPYDGDSQVGHYFKDWQVDSVRCRGGKSFKADADSIVTGAPDGARFLVRIRWARSTGAHFFMARNVGGKAVYENPQNPAANAEGFFNSAGRNGNWVLRIDNREITDAIGKAVEPVKA